MDRRKVFLSSVRNGLIPVRNCVREAICKLDGFDVIWMEDFGLRDTEPRIFCPEAVRDCDIFVCILGRRYGSRTGKDSFSFTEAEYNEAVLTRKPRLIALSADTWTGDKDSIKDQTAEDWQSIIEFRRRACNDWTTDNFTSGCDAARMIVTGLANWERAYTKMEPAARILQWSPPVLLLCAAVALVGMPLERVAVARLLREFKLLDDLSAQWPRDLLSPNTLAQHLDDTRRLSWKSLDTRSTFDARQFGGKVFEVVPKPPIITARPLPAGLLEVTGRLVDYSDQWDDIPFNVATSRAGTTLAKFAAFWDAMSSDIDVYYASPQPLQMIYRQHAQDNGSDREQYHLLYADASLGAKKDVNRRQISVRLGTFSREQITREEVRRHKLDEDKFTHFLRPWPETHQADEDILLPVYTGRIAVSPKLILNELARDRGLPPIPYGSFRANFYLIFTVLSKDEFSNGTLDELPKLESLARERLSWPVLGYGLWFAPVAILVATLGGLFGRRLCLRARSRDSDLRAARALLRTGSFGLFRRRSCTLRAMAVVLMCALPFLLLTAAWGHLIDEARVLLLLLSVGAGFAGIWLESVLRRGQEIAEGD